MTSVGRIIFAALILSINGGAQLPPRNWADRREYNLATDAFQERDPKRQLDLLREWKTQYPHTEFERERITTFVVALRRLRDAEEAFSKAAELSKLDMNDPGALLLIATLGPSLPSPSRSQVDLVVNAASKLRTLKLGRVSPDDAAAGNVAKPLGADTQQIFVFIRELRQEHEKNHPDPIEVLKNEVIESALRWAKNVKPQ
jgi:hypothetical protein